MHVSLLHSVDNHFNSVREYCFKPSPWANRHVKAKAGIGMEDVDLSESVII